MRGLYPEMLGEPGLNKAAKMEDTRPISSNAEDMCLVFFLFLLLSFWLVARVPRSSEPKISPLPERLTPRHRKISWMRR